MKNKITAILELSKKDIFPEDYLMDKKIDDEELEEFILDNFQSISEYVIKRLEDRIIFLKED